MEKCTHLHKDAPDNAICEDCYYIKRWRSPDGMNISFEKKEEDLKE